MKYRAWGALKHRSYGNNLNLDLNYNSRLQMSQYNLVNAGTGASVMGLQYRYTSSDTSTDNDGNLKYSHDLTNRNLDRPHFYDQADRQSGGNAGTPQYDGRAHFTSGPYEQGYYYDVWGNLTGRQWRTFETISFPGGSYYGPFTHAYQDTFVNNRDTSSGWQYDAEGQLLTSVTNATRHFSYDATGAMISASEPNKTINQSFAGDGRRIKYMENGNVTYYVSSSALGGQVITELDQYGQKR